uniref:J domain-containing protein n=1 Tax=Proboscia inermis TaxID=420281 RepID=A0A7S0GMX5_9STRA|mmetsp:Transcript_52937/g.53343  ORF Transcript_52937/g.53343 Transcript_52937/m.53343 type:complete len:521 (+) Transcript_52937:250-1812(+)
MCCGTNRTVYFHIVFLRIDYRGAIAQYTLAIEIAKTEIDQDSNAATSDLTKQLASYYGNRAAAFTMLLKYREAIADCDEAITHDRAFIKAHSRKAKVLTTLGDIDGAIIAYGKGLIHDPNNASIVKEKDDIIRIKNRFELAKQCVIDCASVASSDKSKRKARQALAQIDLVLTTCTAWNDAILLKIEALSLLNRVDEAYALSTKLIRLGMSSNSKLLFLRAKCLFAQGCLDDAMKHLRQILSGDPDNKSAMMLMKALRSVGRKKDEADKAYKNRNFENAINLYTEAIELCPDENSGAYRAKLYFNRATSNANLRKHDQCVADCTRAIKLDDGYTKAYLRRAASYLVVGGVKDCEMAIRDYECLGDKVNSDEQKRDIQTKLRAAKVQLKRAGRKDFYKILGVARDADESEIKKAYRKMALKFHPDRQASGTEEEKQKAEVIFRDVNHAYEVLSDQEKKRRYDSGVDEQDLDNPNARPGGGHDHGGMGGIDPNVLFQMFMQQQGGGGGGRGGGGRGQSFHFG